MYNNSYLPETYALQILLNTSARPTLVYIYVDQSAYPAREPSDYTKETISQTCTGNHFQFLCFYMFRGRNTWYSLYINYCMGGES